MRLDDMVLIKDNHLALVSDLGKAIRLARKNVGSSVKVECEARTKEEALAVVQLRQILSCWTILLQKRLNRR